MVGRKFGEDKSSFKKISTSLFLNILEYTVDRFKKSLGMINILIYYLDIGANYEVWIMFLIIPFPCGPALRFLFFISRH